MTFLSTLGPSISTSVFQSTSNTKRSFKSLTNSSKTGPNGAAALLGCLLASAEIPGLLASSVVATWKRVATKIHRSMAKILVGSLPATQCWW